MALSQNNTTLLAFLVLTCSLLFFAYDARITLNIVVSTVQESDHVKIRTSATAAAEASKTTPLTAKAQPPPTRPSTQQSTNGSPFQQQPLRNDRTIIIPTNNSSDYVNSDIVNVIHVPSEFRIEVHLGTISTRECQNPLLKGRISGWSLSSLIDFDFVTTDDAVLVGRYDLSELPISGKYYLEIIVVLCERYDSRSTAILDLDLRDVCLYKTGAAAHHEITKRDSTIDIIVPKDNIQKMATTTMGRWVHNSLLGSETSDSSIKYHPLEDNSGGSPGIHEEIIPPQIYTRYMYDERCWNIKREVAEEDFVWSAQEIKLCFNSSRVSYLRFLNYTYQWNQQGLFIPLSQLDKVTPSEKRDIHVCFVGMSHSRELTHHCRVLLGTNPNIARILTCSSNSTIEFPSNLTADNIRYVVGFNRCTHAVVGLFQWYFSFKKILGTKPVTFSEWKADMSSGVQQLVDFARQENSGLRKIVLRSAHPNAMGWIHQTCPTRDARSLPNAIVATSLVKDIAKGFSTNTNTDQEAIVSFVDTSFLIHPVWDSAQDCSHYSWESGLDETEFILSKILQEELGQAT